MYFSPPHFRRWHGISLRCTHPGSQHHLGFLLSDPPSSLPALPCLTYFRVSPAFQLTPVSLFQSARLVRYTLTSDCRPACLIAKTGETYSSSFSKIIAIIFSPLSLLPILTYNPAEIKPPFRTIRNRGPYSLHEKRSKTKVFDLFFILNFLKGKPAFRRGRWLQKVSKVPVFKGCTYKKSLYYRLISLILEISPLHKISRFSVILSADQSHHFSCSRQAIVSSSNRLRIVLIGFPPTM